MAAITMTGDATVTTSEGRVRGNQGHVRSFLGIPFAQAPIGTLRWVPPQPHEGWNNVLDATAFRADCTQRRHVDLRGSEMSENCLFLNVWTPARTADEALPVIVWIHGDGYVRGSGSVPTYDGEALAEHGVVLVTINYRLGLPGFLAHPVLTAESPHASSGNYGLLDQIAALSWVKRNIAAFGGDPERVTVSGQSAGGTCTGLLMASPLADGLIDQAILLSPGSMRPMAMLNEAEANGARLGVDIDALRKVPIDELLEMTDLIVPLVRKLASPRGLGPIIDGWIVRGDDIWNYRTGAVRPIPLLVGTDAQEGRRLARRFPIKTIDKLDAYLEASFGSDVALPQGFRAAEDDEVPAALERVIGATQFNYGAWSITQGMKSLDGPVFQYLFAQPSPETGIPPTHDDELPYVFGTLHYGGIRPDSDSPESYGPVDQALSETMMRAWTCFARTGNPNDEMSAEWPKSDIRGLIRVFGEADHLTTMPRTAELEFLRDFFGHPHL